MKKEKIAKKFTPVRIIKPHHIKARKVEKKDFLKKDFKKIQKVGLDMKMLAYNAEKENLFGSVFAVAHSQVIKKSLKFFILNTENQKIRAKFGNFIDKFGSIVINPDIVPGMHSSKPQAILEGSLSCPGREMVLVDRYYKVTIKFNFLKFNDKGKVSGLDDAEISIKGFEAQLFQNMIDELNGVDIYKRKI